MSGNRIGFIAMPEAAIPALISDAARGEGNGEEGGWMFLLEGIGLGVKELAR